MHVTEQQYLGHVPERTTWPHGELLLQCVACGGRDTYPAAPGLPRGCRGLPPRVHSRWAGPVVRLVVVPPLTAAAFEAAYARRSGLTVAQLRSYGRVVRPCHCGEPGCEGWQSVSAELAALDDELAAGS